MTAASRQGTRQCASIVEENVEPEHASSRTGTAAVRRRRRLASILLGGLVTAVAAAAVAAAAVAAGGVSLAATAYLVGPDVSSFQHPNGAAINWDTVFGSGGQSFAIVKATEGTNFTSPTFAGD